MVQKRPLFAPLFLPFGALCVGKKDAESMDHLLLHWPVACSLCSCDHKLRTGLVVLNCGAFANQSQKLTTEREEDGTPLLQYIHEVWVRILRDEKKMSLSTLLSSESINYWEVRRKKHREYERGRCLGCCVSFIFQEEGACVEKSPFNTSNRGLGKINRQS